MLAEWMGARMIGRNDHFWPWGPCSWSTTVHRQCHVSARYACLQTSQRWIQPTAVCTTLSFSGSTAFTRLARKFDVVVIDEAAQVRNRFPSFAIHLIARV